MPGAPASPPRGSAGHEAAGILPPPRRGSNGYRLYTESDLSRLKLILTLRRLGLGPAEAGRLARRCLDGAALDPELAAALDDQRRRIADQREELERLEIELVDLESTIDAAATGPAGPERALITVLFVCNGNSARSQMGEALLGRFGGEDFRPLSGGTRPKRVHPLTVRVLAELGIDWRAARAKPVTELLNQPLDYVITLSNSAREQCPAFPGLHSSLHWHLEDPAAVAGSDERAHGGVPRHADGAIGAAPPIHRDRASRRRSPAGGGGARHSPRRLIMVLPYIEPLTLRQPGKRVIPEPPRRGEAGGESCGLCDGGATEAVWSDEHFTLHPPVGGSLPGTVWLASRAHVDSFKDLPAEAAAAFAPLAGRIERAILSLGDIGRVHVYRWGDGGAHFHVWFLPRPLGMLEAKNHMLPLWEDVLPNVSDQELADAARRVAAAL